MILLGIGTDEAVTYGDLLLILGIMALAAVVFAFFSRSRR